MVVTKPSEETKIAVLSANFDNLATKVDRVLAILDNLPTIYLPVKEHVEFVNAVEKRFTTLETEIASGKRNREISTWIERLSIGVAVSIITYLLMFYLQH